ncbi:hypothetical protein MMPV_002593 [Pyropia vietnamensis]
MAIRAARRRATSSTTTPALPTISSTAAGAITTAATATFASCAAAAPIDWWAEVHPLSLAALEGLITAASRQDDDPDTGPSKGVIAAIVCSTILVVFCLVAVAVVARKVLRRRRLATDKAAARISAVEGGGGSAAQATIPSPVGQPFPPPSPVIQAATAAGVAAPPNTTAPAPPTDAGPNGSDRPAASLPGGGGSGGGSGGSGDGSGAAADVLPPTVDVGAKADVASALAGVGATPGVADGLGVSTSEVSASMVESGGATSVGWVPHPPLVAPQSAPENPASAGYVWSPQVAYAAAAPGSGGPYARPIPLAYVGGGGGVSDGRLPYLPTSGMLALPTGAVAVAAGPPPSLPPQLSSLYDTHGPEDPALVARVTPAPPPVSPPVGDMLGLLPAESFSDRVDVDVLFRQSTEEIATNEQR